MPTFDELVSWFTEQENEIYLLEQQIADVRTSVQEKLNAILESKDEPLRQQILSYLYWNANLNIGHIIRYAYMRSYSYKTLTTEAGVDTTCDQCQSPMTVHFTSVSNRNEYYAQFVAWSRKPYPKYAFHVCAECEEKNSNAQRQRSIQEYEAKKQAEEQAKAQAIHMLKTMPYREYLQTDHWQALRKRMLKRAGYRCQLCNSEGRLHVHHRTYENRGNESYSDLIVLCPNCHAKHHDKI